MIAKIKQKYKHGLIIHYVLTKFSSVGIGIHPFYLVREGCNHNYENIEPKIAPIEARFLMQKDLRILCQNSIKIDAHKIISSRLANKCKCFGLFYHNNLAAYMWCNFLQCDSYLSFPLKSNEVYLFDAVCEKEYRGKNLVPFLRKKLYKKLNEEGYDVIYSITERFNTSAVNFKKKLGAINLNFYVHINIFKFKKNFLLKKC